VVRAEQIFALIDDLRRFEVGCEVGLCCELQMSMSVAIL
jgi:hypothetical protein